MGERYIKPQLNISFNYLAPIDANTVFKSIFKECDNEIL
jgi:hypothetical protein